MTSPGPVSPAKKPRGRVPKAASSEGSAVKAKKPRAVKAGQEAKPKGRKKGPVLAEELAPEELPKGPSFTFEIDHVLALGSRCGLAADRAARDELSSQHAVQQLHPAVHHPHLHSATGNSSVMIHPAPPASASTESSEQAIQVDDGSAVEQPEFAGMDSVTHVPLSELPLRDRLHKVRQLLREAGLSPAQALLSLNSPDAAESSAAVPVAGLQGSPSSISDLAYTCLDSRQATDAHEVEGGKKQFSDGSPVSKLASGATYDELICLISPSPKHSVPASDRLTDANHPLYPSHLALQLSPPGHPLSLQHDSLILSASSPRAVCQSSMPSDPGQQPQQRQPNDSFAATSAAVDSIHQSAHRAVAPVLEQPVLYSDVSTAQQAMQTASSATEHQDGMSEFSGHGAVSCQPSPDSSTGSVLQQGKKRSRSACFF